MKRVLTLLLIPLAFATNGQSEDEPCTTVALYIGVGREALVYFKIEPFIYYKDWGQALFNLGYSRAPGSIEDGIHTFNSINSEVGHTFGYKWIFLNVGIGPALNFQNHVTFIDINGVLGLRYQNKNPDRKFRFAEVGYLPKLYYTHDRNIQGSTYFSIGITL